MFVSAQGQRAALVLLLLAVLLWSCRRENPSNFDRNLPPETYISGAPAESTLSYYQVHLFWHGSDPDGSIDYYEYALTDSNKSPGEDDPDFSGFYVTLRTDSLFRLSADDPQILGHRFYIRAVDNEGKFDPTPAWTYFVAHNYNFPQVEFLRAVGRWTTGSGNDTTINIRSTNRFSPTDTIGVGGCVEFSWTGSDADVGGEVVGYEYRLSAETAFLGGSLADTSLSRCYPDIFSPSPFSGGDAIFVRAIDDAGARTLPDSIRAYLVNFGPVVKIVDPENVVPTARRSFRDEDKGRVWDSGTTLADGTRRITFNYVGYDDLRDQKRDPSEVGVTGFSWRRLENGGGQSYRPLGPTEWLPHPAINTLAVAQTAGLTSGEWMFLVRATDALGRPGKPDTVVVNVNYPPYMTELVYVAPDGAEQSLWDPLGGSVITVSHPFGGENPPPFRVRVGASDTHLVSEPHPLDPTPVVEDELGLVLEFRVQTNGSLNTFNLYTDENREFDLPTSLDAKEAGTVRPGCDNEFVLSFRDSGTGRPRQTNVIVPFCVTPE